MIQQILDIQNNIECWNYSRGLIGGQDSKRISRNMCKDVSNTNKTRFSTNEKQENYIYWRFQRDHGRKLALA